MGCVLLLVLFGFPRIALIWLWFAREGWVAHAFGDQIVWPLVGFFVMPTTTLAFAYGMNSLGAPGEMTPLGWLLTIVALFFDFGVHRSSVVHTRRDRSGGE